MVPQIPDPIISRQLEKDGQLLFVVVEHLNEAELAGDVYRLRAHFHPVGTRRTADWSNVIVKDETGNKYDLRLAFVKFLLNKRDEGWRRTGAANMAKRPNETAFWQLDDL